MSRKKSGERSARGRRGGVTATPETPYVSVFCVGDVKSPHAKWRIATFHPDVHEQELVWIPYPRLYFEPGSPDGTRVSGKVSQRLDGDNWIPQDDREYDYYQPTFRIRWSIGCRECGMRKVIASPSDYYPVFTALAQLGMQEIELNHLLHSNRHTNSQ